jgi:hypothetical protein
MTAAEWTDVILVCPDTTSPPTGSRSSPDAGELPTVAALGAQDNGRPAGKTGVPPDEGFAAALKAARFGVAVWSAVQLDALAIEMPAATPISEQRRGFRCCWRPVTRYSGCAVRG